MLSATTAVIACASGSPASAAEVTVGTYARGVNVAASRGVVAVAEPHGKHAALLVGADDSAPAAIGSGSLPAWGLPHVGTNAAGGAVVTYPRCLGGTTASCDLYAWDVGSERESRVAGVNGSATGEIEGVEDHGNVLVARAPASDRQPGDLSIFGNPDEVTTLVYRPAGGRARVLSAKGGRQLALHGTRIAQVRNTYVSSDGGSNQDSPTLELLSTAGQAARRVRKMVSGEAFQTFTAPTFVSGSLIAGVRWVDRRGYVVRYNLATGAVRTTRAAVRFLTYVPTSSHGGYELTSEAQGTPPTSDVYTLSTVSDATR